MSYPQQDEGVKRQQSQSPDQGKQYGQPPPQQQPQYLPPQDAPPQQYYAPQPPQNGIYPPPPSYDSHVFDQTFKISKPKFNDIWAGVLFLLVFAGFVVVSGLAIHGYSDSNQGNDIYNNATTASEVGLNTNTVILL
jgi:hypothetical protein